MISILIFVLLITVFDKNNLIEAWRLKQDLKELETQKDYYQEKITQDSLLLERLKNDEFLEQYARENFLMKREGDEVFVVK